MAECLVLVFGLPSICCSLVSFLSAVSGVTDVLEVRTLD